MHEGGGDEYGVVGLLLLRDASHIEKRKNQPPALAFIVEIHFVSTDLPCFKRKGSFWK